MSDLVELSEARKYGELFRFELAWNAPDHKPLTVDLGNGQAVAATNVASYRGLRVWETPHLLDSKGMAAVDREVAKTTNDRLVIFHDAAQQVWQWPSRTIKGTTVVSRPARHRHRTDTADPKFADKLEAIKLPLDERLEVVEVLERVRHAFNVETKNETKRASKLMVKLYTAVEKQYAAGYDAGKRDHEISVSLARILFLLFGDDTEMWTTEQFQDYIKDHTARDGSDIGQRVNQLFEVLNRAPDKRRGWPAELAGFPYVNGGIFAEPIKLPPLDQAFRDAVLEACDVDWSTISPAIFGSMFQSVRDSRIRRELGEHYTSEENIRKTLDPLFLDELWAELDRVRSLQSGQRQQLHNLWNRLGRIRFFDPACGCGNFIIVAYRELRSLELAVMSAFDTLNEGVGAVALDVDWTHLLKVNLENFSGIEIDEWPARIAETAMFLVDRQCDLRMRERFGEAPQRLPIRRQSEIRVANALDVDWEEIFPPSADVMVAGNPPFLGHGTRSENQSAELRRLWDRDDIGRLDYATGWYAKALAYFGDRPGRWAFVSTNSICQGEPVPALFGPIKKAGWEIRFAHRTFAWESEAQGAATVHCVIVGFERPRRGRKPRLFDYTNPVSKDVQEIAAPNINAYLVNAPDVFIEQSRLPIAPDLARASFGSRPNDGGALIVRESEFDEVARDEIARKYLRRFVGSRELLHGGQRWCLWLRDAPTEHLVRSPVIRERIELCRAHRLASKRAGTRDWADRPHLFDFDSQPSTDYLCVPGVVSEHREYFTAARFPPSVVTSNLAFTMPDPDGFQFAVVSSSMFITWQKSVGGRLESRLRFSNTVVWNSLPLRRVPPDLRVKATEAGRRIQDARDTLGDLPLAQLYSPHAMPASLRDAHRQLDGVMDVAFGATRTVDSEEERQELLFKQFARLTR